MSRDGGGGAWWNDESQSWETGPDASGARQGGGAGAGDGAGPGAVPAPGSAPWPVQGPGPAPAGGSGPVVPAPVPASGGGHGVVPFPGDGYGPGPVVPMPHLPPVPPVPPPAPPGESAGARPGARNAVIAGVVVGVLAAGSVGGWLLWGRGGSDDGKGSGATAAPSAPATSGPASGADGGPSGTASDSPSPSDGVPPAGFRLVRESGFALAVPEGWNRTSSGSSVFYNAPDGLGLVQVYSLDEPGITPYEALRQTSRDLAAKNPGYREISLTRTGAGEDAAELVYSYDRTEGRRKVVDRAFVGGDGRQYAVLAAGPESAWPEQRRTLDTALEFFTP